MINDGGGGPIESFVRMVTQKNTMTNLDAGVFDTIIEKLDYLLILMMQMLTYLVHRISASLTFRIIWYTAMRSTITSS